MTILCVGKLKEKYWKQAVEEYSKRLSKFHTIKIITVEDEKDPSQLSEKNIQLVLEKEGSRILKHVRPEDYVLTLEIEGKMLNTLALADFFQKLEQNNAPHLVFIIGGSYGLADEVKRRSNFALSFSPLTFPHQMMRVQLLEQIYRCAKINTGQTYHK